MSQIILDEGTAPSAPGTNKLAVYATTNSRLAVKNDAGNVFNPFGILETAVASTSGTSIDYSDLPPGIREINVMFSEVSLSSTGDILVQLGYSSGLVTTGYVATSNGVSSSTGFIVDSPGASALISGILQLYLLDAATFEWVSFHATKTSITSVSNGGGTVTLPGELTQLRITATGANSFDAGKVNIAYRF